MSYRDYAAKALKKQNKMFGPEKPSIDQVEDKYWANISTKRIYSLNNPISLFGSGVKQWNLNEFTQADSNIHFIEPHHKSEVSPNVSD